MSDGEKQSRRESRKGVVGNENKKVKEGDIYEKKTEEGMSREPCNCLRE